MPINDPLFPSDPQTTDLETLIAKTEAYIQGSRSPATLRAYKTDVADFQRFCLKHGLAFLPATPTTVALYISDRAGSLAAATINRRLAAISSAHQAAGWCDSPTSSHHFVVSQTLKGVRRANGTAQHGKDPLLTRDIRRIVRSCPAGLAGLRDKALVLVGFAGAFRRSEVAAIDVEDLTFRPDGAGLVIDLRRSKADQEKKGRKIGIPFGSVENTCPVRALRRWLKEAEIRTGRVFRAIERHGNLAQKGLNPDSVGWILKRAIARAGMNDRALSGHSLRAGHVTQAALNGVNERDIMRQTGHRSQVTLGRYIRIAAIFARNSAAGLGI